MELSGTPGGLRMEETGCFVHGARLALPPAATLFKPSCAPESSVNARGHQMHISPFERAILDWITRSQMIILSQPWDEASFLLFGLGT
jgi:hypothetical protein